MRKLAEGLYVLALTAWIGGMWAVGYLVAPVLFASLGDRALAGRIAGELFHWIGLGGFVAGGYALMFLLGRWRSSVLKRSVFWLVFLLLTLTAVGQFGIQPLMAQMKADALPRDVMESVLRDRFVTWHGIASILYLIQSVIGGWLILWSARGLR